MAKYSGNVGYVITEESRPGVWMPVEQKRFMKGDVLNLSSRDIGSEKVNQDVKLTNRISIVADAFAFENFMHIKFVEFAGHKWEVSSVEIFHPRIILNVGGLYNGS